MHRRIPAWSAITFLVATTCCSVVYSEESVDKVVSGVWQKHQYRFQFMGNTSTYSCDGLADKLAALLRVAGARKDLKSIPIACAYGFGMPDDFATAYLTFYTLANPTGNNGEAKVPAMWRTVEFARSKPLELSAGDCELVERFRVNVLPMFTTSNMVNHMSCIPHQITGSAMSLKFDVLADVPAQSK